MATRSQDEVWEEFRDLSPNYRAFALALLRSADDHDALRSIIGAQCPDPELVGELLATIAW